MKFANRTYKILGFIGLCWGSRICQIAAAADDGISMICGRRVCC